MVWVIGISPADLILNNSGLCGLRQVDELQEVIAQLKLALASKNDSPDRPKFLDLEDAQQQELIADLKLQLAQVTTFSSQQTSNNAHLSLNMGCAGTSTTNPAL